MDACRNTGVRLSFVILMIFWHGHHSWSRRYGLDDLPTIALSCLLVFVVLIYVYPLTFMFGVLAAWVSWLTTGQATEFGINGNEVDGLFISDGCGCSAMTAAVLLLYVHAWRQRDALKLNELERFDMRTDAVLDGVRRRWAALCAACVALRWIALRFAGMGVHALSHRDARPRSLGGAAARICRVLKIDG